MFKTIGFCLVLGIGSGFSSYSQQTAVYTENFMTYQQATRLFNKQQYQAAQNLFKEAKQLTQSEELKADCDYFIALCAVRTQASNAEQLLDSFVQNHPTSTKRNSAYYNVANYYFSAGNYVEARNWYNKVDVDGLSKEEKTTYYFNNGYTYFKAGRTNEAKKYLNRVRDDQEFGAQAKYYLGFMAYEGDEYEKANQMFDAVKGDKRLDKTLSYFQADMNFKLGKFEEAIALGKEQLDRSNRLEKSELNKIIGESYFNLGQYEEAIPYLKEYQGKRGKWNNTDYYQLGYAYYKQGEYQNAINEFKKIIDGQNHVAQNAYYHLAESYVELNQKQQALNAFKNASEMDFEPKIQEDAALNYAKLSYEIGNSYKSIPEVLTDFVERYPNNPATTEIQNLLIDSYITSKNYKKALDLLEGSKRFSDKQVYQKVSFYRGVELYNENRYSEALLYFNQSLANRSDALFTAKATYWKAETQYNLGNFKEALIGYKEFLGMPKANATEAIKAIDYNIAYAYFKTKDYTQAIKHFKKYSEQESVPLPQKNDTYLRLGDSYFVSSDYWPAMEAYNKAIGLKGIDSDYAYFQKAISYGFVDKNERKIEDLNNFIAKYPSSIYKDDALYELGNTYVAEGKTNQALAAYKRLQKELPTSSYVSKSMLKVGLLYYNNNQGEQALGTFKKVVADYPNTTEANQAVKTARSIYVDLGRTEEYAQWVSGLDFVEVADSDIDNATYEAAELPFIENKMTQAKKGFEKYLNQFPKGLHALSAHFYLAQINYADENYAAAIPHYQYVINQSRSEFTEQSLARLGQVYLEQEDYKSAIPILTRLEQEADFPQNITFAQSNLMKAYYAQEQYAQTITYADRVLENQKIENSIKSDAQVFIARAAIKLGDDAKARKAYEAVKKIAQGALAAEAHYYDAYFLREDGDYQKSNEAVQTLARDYSGYKKFGGKGLLVMAKNFYDLNDAYQSTYVLENIIKNFKAYPDLVEEAKAELIRIKTNEAKTNSSVETPQN